MEKEIKINGYRCKFIDNAKEPEYEFLCIPIVHDVKYIKSWATIGFTPEEKETFGKRICILDSRMIPSTVPNKALTIFVFTYQEDEDIEFIKRNTQFFFKEGKSFEKEPGDDIAESAIIKSVGPEILNIVKTIRDLANFSLKDAKCLVNEVRDGFPRKLVLDHLSVDTKRLLLNELRKYNVKFTLQ